MNTHTPLQAKISSFERNEDCSAVTVIKLAEELASILRYTPKLGDAWFSRFSSMLEDLDEAREEIQG